MTVISQRWGVFDELKPERVDEEPNGLVIEVDDQRKLLKFHESEANAPPHRARDHRASPPGFGVRVSDMRRVVAAVFGAYLLAAVVTSAVEAVGVGRPCGCRPDCWCKRPGLQLFRWVAPVAHRSLDPAEKAALA
jgi:hypothetical protein